MGGAVTDSQKEKNNRPDDSQENGSNESKGLTSSVNIESTQPVASDIVERQEHEGSGGGWFVGFLALLVASGIGIAGYLFWQENESRLAKIDQDLSTLKKTAAQGGNLSNRMSQFRSSFEQALAVRAGKIEEEIDGLRATLEKPTGAVTKADIAGLKAGLADLVSQVDASKAAQQQFVDTASLETMHAPVIARMDAVDAKVDKLNTRLDSLAAALNSGVDKALMRDVAHLLRMASDALNFDHNPEVALKALSEASQRLDKGAVEGAGDIAAAIASSIEKVKSVTLPDYATLSVDLVTMQNSLDALPVAQTGPHKAPGAAGVSDGGQGTFDSASQVAGDVWKQLKGLVAIRHKQTDEEPLPAPEQRIYLIENARLKLEIARLALAKRDDKGFHDSLAMVKSWLNRYAPEGGQVSHDLLEEIKRLDGIDISPQMPDISDTLTKLQSFVTRQGQAMNGDIETAKRMQS